MTELFIKSVQEYPCLWNTKISSYKKLPVKEIAWKDVLKKTNMQCIRAAKIKWKSLRDTHREKLKKIREGKKVKPWRYMSHMEFLVPYVLLNATENSSENSHNNTEAASPEPERTRESDDGSLRDILKEIKRNQEERRREAMKMDSLKAFFDSMHKSTAQLPLDSQRKIKKHLFTMVMEAEESFQPVHVKRDIDVASTTNSEDSAVDIVSSPSRSPAKRSGFRLIMDDDSDSD